MNNGCKSTQEYLFDTQVLYKVLIVCRVLYYFKNTMYTERKKKRIFTLVVICIKDAFIM